MKESVIGLKEEIKILIDKYKNSFFIIMLIGIIIHLFVLTNKLLNWDEINALFSKGGTFELGRWGLEIIKYIFPNFSMPVYNGITSIILLTISSILICDILEIKSKSNQILVGCIIIAFPSFVSTMSYMFTVHAYMLAFLLSVLCVYFAKKENKVSFFTSIILLIASLSIYQVYFSIVATMMIILLLKELSYIYDSKKILKKALKFLGILISSLLLYILITILINNLMKINLSDYQGISNIGAISFLGIIKGSIKSYKQVLYPIISKNVIAPTIFSRIIYVCIGIFDIIFICLNIFKNRKNKVNIILTLFFVLLLPITMNIMYLFSEDVMYHALMMFGNCFIYIFFIMCYDNENNKITVKNFFKILIIVQIFIYITLANEAYLKLHLSYENTYAFYQGVVTSIKNTEGFTEDSKIAIVGEYETFELTEFKYVSNYTGIASSSNLINSYSKKKFMEYYLGFSGNFIEQEEIKNILKKNQEFKDMPKYPYYGSVKKIDDIIVVKLSDYIE